MLTKDDLAAQMLEFLITWVCFSPDHDAADNWDWLKEILDDALAGRCEPLPDSAWKAQDEVRVTVGLGPNDLDMDGVAVRKFVAELMEGKR